MSLNSTQDRVTKLQDELQLITEFKHNYLNVLLFVKIISGHSCVEVPETSQLNRFRLELAHS